MIRNLEDICLFAFPVTFCYIILRLSLAKKIKINIKRESLNVVFSTYISSLIFIVWLDGSYYSNTLNYNLVPLRTMVSYIGSGLTTIVLKNLIGNIVITMPIGFFIFCKIKISSKLHVFMYSFFIPIIIESGQFILVLQRIRTRSIDIDDILLNTIGILIGYFFTRQIFTKKIENKNVHCKSISF